MKKSFSTKTSNENIPDDSPLHGSIKSKDGLSAPKTLPLTMNGIQKLKNNQDSNNGKPRTTKKPTKKRTTKKPVTPPTVPSTEAVTEPVTEAATEAATEAVTEAVAEEVTEPQTES